MKYIEFSYTVFITFFSVLDESNLNFLDISLNADVSPVSAKRFDLNINNQLYDPSQFVSPSEIKHLNDSTFLDISRCSNNSIVLNSSETHSDSEAGFQTPIKGYIFYLSGIFFSINLV